MYNETSIELGPTVWLDVETHEPVYIYGTPTDEQAVRFIPQSHAAQGLFWAYREIGKSTVEALCLVLEAACGIKKEQ